MKVRALDYALAFRSLVRSPHVIVEAMLALTAEFQDMVQPLEPVGGNIGRIMTNGDITKFPYPVAPSDSITSGPDGNLWLTGTGKIVRMTTTGEITEFPTPSRGKGITTGPDDALWFASAENTIGRITTRGKITMHTIPNTPFVTSGYVQGVTRGPDNTVWFTSDGLGGKIGKATVFTHAVYMPQVNR